MDNNRSEADVIPKTAEGVEDAVPMGTATEKKSRMRDTAAILRHLLFGALYALWGYLLGTCALPFGAYPLGVAWLCAAERHVPYILIGLCLSAIGLPNPAVRILSYVAALLIRVVVRVTLDKPWESGGAPREHTLGELASALFSEQLGLRMTTACIAAFLVGVYRLIEGGFLYYDLYGALLAMIVAPTATLLFAGVNRTVDASRPYVRTVGLLALACALVYAARDLRVAYVSVSAFGAMVMTLYMTKREGIVKGVLTGALCGLAYMPVLAPLFAFGALCGGLLLPVSVTLATLTTVVVGSAWALYVRGLGALSGILPAILTATVLFAVVDKLFLSEKPADATATDATEDAAETTEEAIRCEAMPASALDGVRLADTAGRVKTVCESFSAMAEVFAAMGHAMQRPTAEELRGICDSAFDSSCASCQGKEACWETCYRETDAEIARLSSVLHREGRVDASHVSDALAGRCTRLPDILDEINHNASLHASRVLESDKTEIFAADYASMADILAETMTAEQGEYSADMALTERLADRLEALGFGMIGVLAWGSERRRVAVRSRDAALSDKQCEAVAEAIGEVSGCRMRVETSERCEDGAYEAIFGEHENLSISFARRTLRADGEEEYCGDSIGVFRRGSTQYAFISDGMGAGREAALTSGICALFLQKMLGAGNRCETALEMLNGFLRNKGSGSLHECSATVDLMALDLLGGRASFYKCGAAPTYVFRDGSLFKIRSKTLPIGILKEPDQKKISFEIHAGDVIVMVSDGVTQGREECPWLFDLLRRNVENLGIEKTADLIVQYAKSEGSTDDLSVLILRVEES